MYYHHQHLLFNSFPQTLDGMFHCQLLLSQDQLFASLDQIEINSSFLKVVHYFLSVTLVMSQPLFNEFVDFVDGFMFAHFLLEFIIGLSKCLFFLFPFLAFVVVEFVQSLNILFLHFQIVSIQRIVQGEILLSKKLRSLTLTFIGPEKVGNLLNICYPFGSIIVHH